MKLFADVQLTFRIPSLLCDLHQRSPLLAPWSRYTLSATHSREKDSGGSMDNPDREMALDEIAKARTALGYQAEKCGMYLGVHAIHRSGTSEVGIKSRPRKGARTAKRRPVHVNRAARIG